MRYASRECAYSSDRDCAAVGGPVLFCRYEFLVGTQTGTVQNNSINEASGIAASRMNSNVLWTHNDSGDSARVFAMTTAGTNLGTYSITGAGAIDWEDIAVGPGPTLGSQYLYAADIGDNVAIRSRCSVYRVLEPVVSDVQSPVIDELVWCCEVDVCLSGWCARCGEHVCRSGRRRIFTSSRSARIRIAFIGPRIRRRRAGRRRCST